MKPIYDHFLVEQTQADIDKEKSRIDSERKRISEAKKSVKSKPRIITSLDESKVKKDELPYIEHYMEAEVYTVAAVGKDCEEVKVGDRVIIRANTLPETFIYKGKLYLSIAERSISVIL